MTAPGDGTPDTTARVVGVAEELVDEARLGLRDLRIGGGRGNDLLRDEDRAPRRPDDPVERLPVQASTRTLDWPVLRSVSETCDACPRRFSCVR